MTEHEKIGREIRYLMDTETNGIELFNKLFQQGSGLFGKLASNEAERRVVSRSPLFQEAQERAHELLDKDAQVLETVNDLVDQHVPGVQIGLSLNAQEPLATTT